MSVSKQGGVLNYLGKQEIVKAPKHWKSSPNSPKTDLAYITEAEKGLLVDANLHGSLLNKPNVGPTSLLSFDGWGDTGDTSDRSHGQSERYDGGGSGGGSPNIGPSLHGGDSVEKTFQTMEEQKLPSGHPEWQEKEAQKTVKSTDTLTTTFNTTGRPDITYSAPDNTTMGNYSSKYEKKQIMHIQDQKLKSVQNKLRVAGFDLPEDATFAETKSFINDLSSDELPNSYKDLKDKHGNPLYDQATLDKWEAEGYIPEASAMNIPGIGGAILNKHGKQLTRDELWMDLDLATEVGKSTDMDWQERMKTYSPKQYEALTGTVYDPHTKTYTTRDGGAGSEQAAAERVAGPYQQGGSIAPQESQAAKWFANTGSSNNTFSFDFQQGYEIAKAKQKTILGSKTAIGQLAVNQSPYYDFLKLNKLDRGIL